MNSVMDHMDTSRGLQEPSTVVTQTSRQDHEAA